ncbi:hypothetical protein ACHAPU_002420 [Fusarium lateritium]
MSFASTFDPYQPLGSKGPAQASSKPFSSRVDFSDSSYDMPYFSSAEAPAPKVQNVQTNTAAFKHNINSSPNPPSKQRTGSRDTASPRHNRALYAIGSSTCSKADYSVFLNSLEFPCISDFKITSQSEIIAPEWLAQDAEFVKWIASKTRLLWLRGSEGSGKTTLMKQVLHKCTQDEPGSIHLTYSFPPLEAINPGRA